LPGFTAPAASHVGAEGGVDHAGDGLGDYGHGVTETANVRAYFGRSDCFAPVRRSAASFAVAAGAAMS